jgi:hypothetical protein
MLPLIAQLDAYSAAITHIVGICNSDLTVASRLSPATGGTRRGTDVRQELRSNFAVIFRHIWRRRGNEAISVIFDLFPRGAA